MKHLLLICFLILFVVPAIHAQRDPSKEILVYFIEGVKREKKFVNGIESINQSINNIG